MIYPGLQDAWTIELEQADATQNFLNCTQNYSVLKGMKANLYKCFLPLGWRLSGNQGVAAYLHPEGPYDDPKGGALRDVLYPRLRAHFQFINELQLFTEVDHHTKYSINLYGPPQEQTSFDHLANLFAPATVDACYAHDGTGIVGGYKSEDGKWNIAGHSDRIVHVTDTALAVFAQLYDEQGTPPRRARLPALHAGALQSVLDKLARYPHSLGNLKENYFSTFMFDESGAQRDGTIHRRIPGDNGFVTDASNWDCPVRTFFWLTPSTKPRVAYVPRTVTMIPSTLRQSPTTTYRDPTTIPWTTVLSTCGAPRVWIGSSPERPLLGRSLNTFGW
jgi:hypothetical protein